MDSAGAHLDSIRSPGRGTGLPTPPGTVEVDPRVPAAPAAAAARAPIPVVRTAGLTKQFGRFNALTDLTVEMTQGEVFGYLGPNGAGKTTTIRLLLEHLPPEWADKFRASIDWSWAFVLTDLPDSKTRLTFRSRLALTPQWVEAFYLALIVPADFIMSRQMLRGVKERAERTTAEDLLAVDLSPLGVG